MDLFIHEWVTGGGMAGRVLPDGWAEEGRAMRRAVTSDFLACQGINVIVTLDARFAAEPSGATFVPMAREEEAALAEILRLTTRCDFTLLIAPETGGVLANVTALIERAGGKTLGSTAEAVRLTADKQRLSEHWLDHHVPTPPTRPFPSRSSLPLDLAYPLVVKPNDGAGSLATFVLEGPGDPLDETGVSGKRIVQPYVAGTPLSASFLVGPSGAVRLIGVGRQRITRNGGAIHYGGGSLPEPARLALGAPLDAVRAVRGLRGFVGVDFVHNAQRGTSTVLEINPRPTTSYVGLQHLLSPGTLARAWLDMLSATDRAEDDLRGMIPSDGRCRVRFLPDGRVVEEADDGARDDRSL